MDWFLQNGRVWSHILLIRAQRKENEIERRDAVYWLVFSVQVKKLDEKNCPSTERLLYEGLVRRRENE